MTARFSYEATASMVLKEAGAPTDTEWERVKSMALTKRRNIVQLPSHLSADQDNTLWCIPVLLKNGLQHSHSYNFVAWSDYQTCLATKSTERYRTIPWHSVAGPWFVKTWVISKVPGGVKTGSNRKPAKLDGFQTCEPQADRKVFLATSN